MAAFGLGNELIVRVVYDGPPRAGKTTSLRSLAAGFGRPVESPGEAEGRTLLFDWMEYVGGWFEGRSIRCQVIAVPGQRSLQARRRALLALADVVIVVGDTTPEGLDELEPHLRELRADLDRSDGVRPGVLVQANKRDLPEALPLEEILRRLDDPDLAVDETVATNGSGVRSAFLHALRLALDRVRSSFPRDPRRDPRPDIEGAEDLMDLLRQADRETAPPEPGESRDPRSDVRNLLRNELADPQGPETPDGLPRPPDPEVNGSLLWPPVRGRLHLLAACSSGGFDAVQSDEGDWNAAGNLRWHAHSFASDCYGELSEARRALGQWANFHASVKTCISPDRALVVTAGGADGWRLWQVVQEDPTLYDLILDALSLESPVEVADRLWRSAQALIGVRVELLKAGLRVPCALETCGMARGRCVYFGRMPSPGHSLPPGPSEDRRTFLRLRFGDAMTVIRNSAGPSIGQILDRLEDRRRRAPSRNWVAEILSALLIEP
ncbi:MAG: GTPase domain-containing protein [Acidobacteria bacterium]|nr:GTPase domain-containing protein [Acidobacteriota bacterium]